ncbi:hypothetical protein BH683_007715 [Williamsia sp. 1138]|nr:hypothetical protein BH683_007715 [Williamsia sp. 1138]
MLAWLAGTSGQHPPVEVCAGNDLALAYDQLRQADLILDTSDKDTVGAGPFVLSAAGRVEASLAAVEYRAELARRGVLRWVLDDYRSLDGLESSDAGNDYTGPLTHREVVDAANELAMEHLLEGERRGDGEFFLVRATPRGQRALRGPAPIVGYQSPTATNNHHHRSTVTISGSQNQVAFGNSGSVDQRLKNVNNSTAIAPGFEKVAESIQYLLNRLDALALNDDDDQEVRDHAAVVVGEIVRDNPDRTTIKRAINSVRGVLAPISLGVAAAATAESTETARGLIEALTGLV